MSQKILTCNQLDLETLGSRHCLSKINSNNIYVRFQDTKKTYVQKRLITIIGWVNSHILAVIGGGGAIWPCNEHENLHFVEEYDIHLSWIS